MAQTRLWLWGLIPLGFLWLAAIWVETGAVESDVGSRAAAAIADRAWIPALVTTRGRDVTLGGAAFDPTERRVTVASVDEVHGVRLVEDRSALVPEVTPYVWSAAKDATTISMRGNVPDPLTRATLRAVGRDGGLTITDAAGFARGAPAAFAAAAALALTQMKGLTTGEISIADHTISVSGVAKTVAGRDAIVAALGRLPFGMTLGDAKIGVPTFDFSAVKDAGADTLKLDGSLPDERAHTALLALVRGAFAGQKVVDHTRIQAGAPPGFGEAATAALEQLSRLDGGTLKISDTSVVLSGRALYARAVDQIDTALHALPSGFTGKADIRAQPPAAAVDAAACQHLFADQLAKGKIQFETASAKIDKVSAGLLDHLAAIALRCPAQTIEISGHTDASGSDQVNMALSKRRAQAVVEYLVTAGFDATHLMSVGYGKTRPIAPNDTEDGKAKNRRIEFLVK